MSFFGTGNFLTLKFYWSLSKSIFLLFTVFENEMEQGIPFKWKQGRILCNFLEECFIQVNHLTGSV